jgi:23S rRNA U2552 (ribose-2'-O)-methylase RlmE/FtsJ
MDVNGFGGPPSSPFQRAEEEWTVVTRKRDRSSFRSPESRALQQCKNEIQKEEKWDDFKKITNPYEYVFLSWNRRASRSVSTRQPLSRSYFKMIEIWKTANLTELLSGLVTAHGGLRTAHSAEGPGGFIEACWTLAEKNEWNVSGSHAITLRSEAKNVPGWRKATRFLAEHPTISISDGADGTGDILSLENQTHFLQTVRKDFPEGVHFYSADGGFDFSSDYNAQEDTVLPLLIAESLLGIQCLAPGGCFVLKCFDTTETFTLDLLWLLTLCFREWSLLKPNTSRAGNAERYFIGKGFVGNVDDIVMILKDVQKAKQWKEPILLHYESSNDFRSWLDWRQKVLDLQEKIEHHEYNVIRQTLDLIHSHDFQRIRIFIRSNIQKSIEWCKEYDEPISHIWSSDFERNVSREAHDLLQILHPEMEKSHSWYTRTCQSLSFEGFRTERVSSITESLPNPFLRFSN